MLRVRFLPINLTYGWVEVTSTPNCIVSFDVFELMIVQRWVEGSRHWYETAELFV